MKRLVTALTDENARAALQEHHLAVLLFWAPWCGSCRAFKETFERVAGSYEDVFFATINTEVETELRSAFSVESVPMLALVHERQLGFSRLGALDDVALRNVIEQAKSQTS
jgi:thioredoxin-like negative regulator of GroEL